MTGGRRSAVYRRGDVVHDAGPLGQGAAATAQCTGGDVLEERRIKIAAGPCRLEAVLNRSRTADLLWDALPLDESASTWGDEIYFRTPAHVKEESDAGEVVEMGDVAYWPPGHALCFFFGPTPASRGDEIRAASPVNVVGRIEGDAEVLKEVRSGERVAVERA